MILEEGKKILVVHRRLFETDPARFFVGIVEGYESGVAKVKGYSWSHDTIGGTYVRKADERTKVFSIVSGTVMTYELPDLVQPARIEIKSLGQGRTVLHSHDGFTMDLTERPHTHT